MEHNNSKTNTMWLASFDIGYRNFSFAVEEIDLDDLSGIQNIPRLQRYFKGGGCTPDFALILNKVYHCGRIILMDNVDLTTMGKEGERIMKGKKSKTSIDPLIFIYMNKCLDKYKDIWDKCTTFIIEQQMSFGKQRNTIALKLGQHAYSYFTFQYAQFKTIVEFPAYYKTQVLGAPKKMSKPDRKRWAVQKTIEILSERNDTKTLSMIQSRKKADDMSDNCCQLQAFKYLVFVDKSYGKNTI